jgi:hypothetical protein
MGYLFAGPTSRNAMIEPAGRLLVAALVLACLPPSQARGQDVGRGTSGRIEGHVVAVDGEGLADVTVSILGRPEGSVTGPSGAFTLVGVSAGWAEVRFTRLGYATYSRRVLVEAGATARLDAVLSEEAIELAPIDISVLGRVVYLDDNGFYRRSERGFGRQYSREDLDALHILEVSDAVRDVSGLVMQYDPYMANRVVALRSRNVGPGGAPCALSVFVDGVRTLDPNLNQVPQDWILGMEVYLGAEAPAQYRLAGACGVVLIWTKDGRL